jgi:hypothetical protein
MTITQSSAEFLVGERAFRSLESRGLLVLVPFPNLSTAGGSPPDKSRSQLTIGAHLGVALSRAARRQIRVTGSCDPRQLLTTAVATRDLQDAHCLQAEESFRVWSTAKSEVPLGVAQALRMIPREVSGVGSALRELWATSGSGPWFELANDSFGYGGVTRCIGVTEALPENQAFASMADMAVTHAHPSATWSAAALSQLLTICLYSERNELPNSLRVLLDEMTRTPLGHESLKLRELLANPTARQVRAQSRGATCESALAAAFASAESTEAPATFLAQLASLGAPSAVLATAGAVAVARHGVESFPPHWKLPIKRFVQEYRGHGSSSAASAGEGGEITSDTDHMWILVDRSGSMKGIRSAMESGFDEFISQQKSAFGTASPAHVTVVQFDDQSVHDVLVDSLPLMDVPSLGGRLQPRGMTPLYDAISMLLDRAEATPRPGERQLVLIITDGLENASQLVTRREVFHRIRRLEQMGWTFVYLGANQDSYSQGGQMAMADGNISNFEYSEAGVDRLYAGLNRATREWRGKDRIGRQRDRNDFWAGRREAEEKQ